MYIARSDQTLECNGEYKVGLGMSLRIGGAPRGSPGLPRALRLRVCYYRSPRKCLRSPRCGSSTSGAVRPSRFVFEPKLDGFRALARIGGIAASWSRATATVFRSWPQLTEEIAHAVHCRSAILDGEICCLEPDGTTNFNRLLFRRDWPWFYAFDALSINGRDLRSLPLSERKERLREIIPAFECRVLFLDSLAGRGCDLFRAACDRDLEGIVGKWAHGHVPH